MTYESAANSPANTSSLGSQHGHAGTDAFHQAAMHLADVRRGTSRFRTRDLVNLLLCHAARSRRASLARATIRIKAYAPEGHTALTLTLS